MGCRWKRSQQKRSALLQRIRGLNHVLSFPVEDPDPRGVKSCRRHLFRYFHMPTARIGVLTGGQMWHFFTDLDRPNRIDERPFLKLDLANVDSHALPGLKKLTKPTFEFYPVLSTAQELK